MNLKSKTVDGIKCVNICDVLEVLYGKGYWTDYTRSYRETRTKVAEWAAANDATMYEADRENFSFIWAAAKAREEGKSAVVCEDLS